MIANAINIVPALGKLLPGFALRLRRFKLLKDTARRIPDFADKFSHLRSLPAVPRRTIRTKFSIRLSGPYGRHENGMLI